MEVGATAAILSVGPARSLGARTTSTRGSRTTASCCRPRTQRHPTALWTNCSQQLLRLVGTPGPNSAHYSVPMRLVGKQVEVVVAGGRLCVVHLGVEMATHDLVAPGETSVTDDHYGGPRPLPRRAPRPRTAAEHCMVGFGEVGMAFLKQAAAAGASKLGSELADIVALESAYGRVALVAALERATTYSRFSLADVRAILDAGPGVARLQPVGEPLSDVFPTVPTRPLSAYGFGELR
jgi:hypothetical protein